MIYGKHCRGNYPRLSQLLQKLPLFPSVNNERSMLYIETLCAFLENLIESGRTPALLDALDNARPVAPSVSAAQAAAARLAAARSVPVDG